MIRSQQFFTKKFTTLMVNKEFKTLRNNSTGSIVVPNILATVNCFEFHSTGGTSQELGYVFNVIAVGLEFRNKS